MKLYHGSNDHVILEKYVFFSTSERFSKDYGETRIYDIKIKKLFDSTNKENIKNLLQKVGSLYDPYDEMTFNTADEFLCSYTAYADTWEVLEPHLDVIKTMGFDTVLLFEGGIENYVTLNNNFKQLN